MYPVPSGSSPPANRVFGLVAELAKATVPTGSTIPWDDWVADYSRIRDAIAQTYPDIFHDFNARLWEPGGFIARSAPASGKPKPARPTS
jgi:hypothetical protein